jgi:hypothetical protein
MCPSVSEMKYSYNRKRNMSFAFVLCFIHTTSWSRRGWPSIVCLYWPCISYNTCPYNQKIHDENIRCYVVLVIRSLCCVCCSCWLKRVNCLMKWIPTVGNSPSVALLFDACQIPQSFCENQNPINIYKVLVYTDDANLLGFFSFRLRRCLMLPSVKW